MRTLLIDAGNTAVKFATADSVGPGAARSLAYAEGAAEAMLDDPQVLRVRIEKALHDEGLARGASAAGCLVASNSAHDAISAAVRAVAGTETEWLGSQTTFDAGGVRLVNGYREPAQLGADRWHAMLGARSLHGAQAFVLVQTGTATTIDGVTAEGTFVGGDIAPGWDMMLASLARGTARLPHAQGHPVAFAANTDDAIASGVRDAQAGAVARFWRRFIGAHARNGGARLILTGGGAARLAAALGESGEFAALPPTIQDNLVLRGLWLRTRHPSVT